jgi:ABC-type lipoprotein export system ATPase subunit
MVTHDPQIAAHARETLYLKDGKVVNRLPNKQGREELINVRKSSN